MCNVLTQIADDSSANKQSLTDKKITMVVNEANINQCHAEERP